MARRWLRRCGGNQNKGDVISRAVSAWEDEKDLKIEGQSQDSVHILNANELYTYKDLK